jgi:Fe-S-cluster formation regulator IscX/YfhJ
LFTDGRKLDYSKPVEDRVRVWNWGQYLFLEDWRHELVASSAARIKDSSKVPQQLYEITADVDPDAVKYSDWMAGTNDVKGYFIEVKKSNFAKLDVITDLRFRLADFKAWFPTSKIRTSYGFSNYFAGNVTPKLVVDAFWAGVDEEDIIQKLDVAVLGRLDNDGSITNGVNIAGFGPFR